MSGEFHDEYVEKLEKEVEKLEKEVEKWQAMEDKQRQKKEYYHEESAKLTMERDRLRADALTMALRLLGEDDSTFGPECHEVMQRWGKIAQEALEG